jgi:isoquinoline 1-oxidoreductase subunit beta
MKNIIQAQPNISRRRFIQGTTASLMIGAYLPMLAKNVMASPTTASLEANAFVKIAADSSVTVLIKHIEFGQGAFTGLASLVADELDAAWSQMKAAHAPANVALYKNIMFGVQGTGGSTGLANSYLTMRQAGASAKALLVAAAAQLWQVDAADIHVKQGVVFHPISGRQAQFGELVTIAAGLSLPAQAPKLKSPEQFIYIGKDLPKLDTADKTKGQAQYTQDIHLPNMLTAVVAHPPLFGAKLKSFDDTQTRKIKGVVEVKQLSNGVAVYAKNTFTAIKGRNALKIDWDNSQAEQRSSVELLAYFKQTNQQPGMPVTRKGNAEAVLSKTSNKIDVEMTFPYLAHAPMEPLDAVMQVVDGKVTCWFGSQIPTLDQGAIAQVFGVSAENVDIQTQLAGGSFGRRVTQDAAFAVEAAQVTKAIGQPIPIKTVWTREDDIQGGYYRPMAVHTISTAVDGQGELTAWQHRIAVQSILKGSPFEGMMQNGIDPSSVEGVSDLRYSVPNLSVDVHNMQVGVPVLWWRSVGHTHTAYAVETMIDVLLERAERDPIAGRIALLADKNREIGVLQAVAALAEQAGPVPEGRARGVAVVQSFGSFVAQIAEVSKNAQGLPHVHRVWCAVDCGLAVNPNVVKAQMEGGIGFGLDAILHGELSLGAGGQVEQSNFHNYTTLRINEMPQIEVVIVPSDAPPTGVGEPGTPPIGPAVANAWRRLTGQFVTTLPFSKGVKLAQA